MLKRIRRILGIVLIAGAIVVTQIPAQEIRASYAKEDFLRDNDTLSKYTGTASTVSVPDDIRIIGEEAFASNQYVENVILDKNLKTIEHGAFSNCTNLLKVIIPDSVKYIDSSAFSGCSSLMNVTLGKGVEDMGQAVFAGCRDIVSVSIPKGNGNFVFENGALYDNKKEHVYAYLCGNAYDTYKMPNTVERIDMYSFWGNEDLMDVYLSDSLEDIPGYAFSNCKNLQYIQIPYSVDAIGPKAFENCVSLKDVEIPASVKYIDETAFDGCPNLNIKAVPGSVAEQFWENYDRSDVAVAEGMDAKVPIHLNGDKIVDKSAEKGTTVTSGDNSGGNNGGKRVGPDGLIDAGSDPSNVEWMPSVNALSSPEDSSVLGKTIIVSGHAVFFINRDMEVNELDASAVKKAETEVSDEPEAGDEVYSGDMIYDSGKGGYLPKYTEIDGRIATMAYYADDSMTEYTIPSDIKSIGKFAFARSGIESVTIPEGVTRIGYGAFYHCDNLKEINIPSSVVTIDEYAFENTPYLSTFKANVGEGPFLIVGDGLLLAYNGNDASVTIPAGVKKICPGCFEGNGTLENITLPDSLIEIGEDAFRDCKKLAVVEGGNNLRRIGARAFMGCPIGTFVVPSSVKEMGLMAIDFTGSGKTDSSKTVVFAGSELPKITGDSATSRLENYEYRNDVLYNCLFAVVDDSVMDVTGTVLDSERLGFSGLVVSVEKDETGNETGNVVVKKNNIFSEDVLEGLPKTIAVKGKNYNIKDFENLSVASKNRSNNTFQKSIDTTHNGIADAEYSAAFSENENVGILDIFDSAEAKAALDKAYGELFGEAGVDIMAYDITLTDGTGTVALDNFGKASLYVTVPVKEKANKYHVVTLDSDGQLEELSARYNEENNSITFETSHLSYVGIYGIGDENVTLNVKDGKLVYNYRLDASPETGDNSFPIKYVVAIAMVAIGSLMILLRPRRRKA